MTIEDELGPPIPEHADIAPKWWACEYPERPAESGMVQFRRECRRCLPAFMAAQYAANGRMATALGTPIARGRGTAMGDTPEEWRAWFMREGEHASRSASG